MVSRTRAGCASARTGLAACLAAALLVVAGCGQVGSSAQDYAQSACDAYQHLGRVQIATTVEQTSAIRDVALSSVRAAAAFDSRWAELSSDMQRALDLPESTSDGFFEVDKRVQDECSDAGRDIGDLKP